MLSIFKMLSFFSGSRALTGLIYHRPAGESSTFHFTLCQIMGNVANINRLVQDKINLFFQNLAVVPSLWIVKLTNSATDTNKFHRVFPRAWSVKFKGLFHPARSTYPRGSRNSVETDKNPTDLELL